MGNELLVANLTQTREEIEEVEQSRDGNIERNIDDRVLSMEENKKSKEVREDNTNLAELEDINHVNLNDEELATIHISPTLKAIYPNNMYDGNTKNITLGNMIDEDFLEMFSTA